MILICDPAGKLSGFCGGFGCFRVLLGGGVEHECEFVERAEQTAEQLADEDFLGGSLCELNDLSLVKDLTVNETGKKLDRKSVV